MHDLCRHFQSILAPRSRVLLHKNIERIGCLTVDSVGPSMNESGIMSPEFFSVISDMFARVPQACLKKMLTLKIRNDNSLTLAVDS